MDSEEIRFWGFLHIVIIEFCTILFVKVKWIERWDGFTCLTYWCDPQVSPCSNLRLWNESKVHLNRVLKRDGNTHTHTHRLVYMHMLRTSLLLCTLRIHGCYHIKQPGNYRENKQHFFTTFLIMPLQSSLIVLSFLQKIIVTFFLCFAQKAEFLSLFSSQNCQASLNTENLSVI